MQDGTRLQARQINHGQSEVWLEHNGIETSSKRTLATNEVVNIARRFCRTEIFEEFYKEYHVAVEHIASLGVPNLDEIATELRLKDRSASL